MGEPSLRELQQWMQSRIRPTAGTLSTELERHVNSQRGTPGVERLSVYAGGYVARTQQALAEAYEAVHHVLGERAFAELAQRYAARFSSHDYNLSFRGRHLSEFLTTDPLTVRLPFLPDLARLEWFISQAFHAFEQPPLDPASLSGFSLDGWDRVRVVFQPSVGVIASAWPIVDIWEARTRPREEVDIDLINRPQRALVFRQGLTVRCERVDEPQHRLLDGLLAGRPLGAVCEELAHTSAAELPLDAWCASWARRGLVIRCAAASA